MSYVNLWTAWPGFLSPKKIPETRSRDFCPTKETSCVTRNTEALLFGRIFCGLGALGGSDQWTLERKLPTYISLLSITGIPESPSHEPGIPHPFGSSHSPRKKSFRGKSLGRLATPATSFWGLCWATYIRAIHIIPSFLSFPTSIIKDFVNFCNSQFVWYVCKCWGNLPWWLYIYIYMAQEILEPRPSTKHLRDSSRTTQVTHQTLPLKPMDPWNQSSDLLLLQYFSTLIHSFTNM